MDYEHLDFRVIMDVFLVLRAKMTGGDCIVDPFGNIRPEIENYEKESPFLSFPPVSKIRYTEAARRYPSIYNSASFSPSAAAFIDSRIIGAHRAELGKA